MKGRASGVDEGDAEQHCIVQELEKTRDPDSIQPSTLLSYFL